MESSQNSRKNKIFFVILLIGVIAVNIKRIFTDFEIDAEYAIAMAYRMAKGDRMFLQMWEPHQTSAYFSAFFIRIYMALFRTTTGIVVYLNTVGVLCKAAVTCVLYKTLKDRVSLNALKCACLFFLAVNPKDISLPEFSNMQLWFSVLLFSALLVYFRDQGKKLWLVLSAAFLCLEVTAYPSCIIVYVAVIVVIFLYSKQKWKDVLWMTIPCVIFGCGYISLFAVPSGFHMFFKHIARILSGDASHGLSLVDKLGGYGVELIHLCLWVLAFACVSILLCLLCRQKTKEKMVSVFLGLVFIAGAVSVLLLAEDYPYLYVYVVIWVLGFAVHRTCQETTKQIFVIGISISLSGVLATLCLTNLSLYSVLGYGILGVVVSLICLGEFVEKQKRHLLRCLIPVFLILTVFREGYITKPMNPEPTSILDIRGIVKSGPAVGMMSTYMGPYMVNTSMKEWQQYIEPGDSLLLVGREFVHTLGYLYEDTKIAVPSTICTPTYSGSLLEYWQENPDKYPTVIAVDCWYGDLRVDKDSWIMQWIEETWQPDEIIDGAYWRYYIKR